MPLMEIVTEPDARSPAEAIAYLTKLRQILRYLGVSDANMEEGSFRCEPNLSLRPKGTTALGSKVELKNLNSFRAALRGMEFEVERQARILDEGGHVASETRGWREETNETASQRSKELAHDYRYLPEPDLPPLAISRSQVEELRQALPELPDARRARFADDYGLTPYEANRPRSAPTINRRRGRRSIQTPMGRANMRTGVLVAAASRPISCTEASRYTRAVSGRAPISEPKLEIDLAIQRLRKSAFLQRGLIKNERIRAPRGNEKATDCCPWLGALVRELYATRFPFARLTGKCLLMLEATNQTIDPPSKETVYASPRAA